MKNIKKKGRPSVLILSFSVVLCVNSLFVFCAHGGEATTERLWNPRHPPHPHPTPSRCWSHVSGHSGLTQPPTESPTSAAAPHMERRVVFVRFVCFFLSFSFPSSLLPPIPRRRRLKGSAGLSGCFARERERERPCACWRDGTGSMAAVSFNVSCP